LTHGELGLVDLASVGGPDEMQALALAAAVEGDSEHPLARPAAGIVLVRNDPRDVVRVIRLSRATYRKMGQNLSWAVGYNALAIPLAAGALAGVGIILPAWVGALLMSFSTIIVALNAQTLRALRLDGAP
jgi:P-type Cu2+ transporter